MSRSYFQRKIGMQYIYYKRKFSKELPYRMDSHLKHVIIVKYSTEYGDSLIYK